MQIGAACRSEIPEAPLPVADRFVKAFLIGARSVGAPIRPDAEPKTAPEKLDRNHLPEEIETYERMRWGDPSVPLRPELHRIGTYQRA